MKKIKTGIIGCGNISSVYFENSKKFDNFEVTACADLIIDRAKEKAKEFNIQKACSVNELLSDKEIQIVINLTIPKAHSEVNLKVLDSGKNVYVEKPLGLSRDEAGKVIDKAKSKGFCQNSSTRQCPI